MRPELNGCPAHVEALDDAKGRYRITIQLGNGKLVSARLKACNLKPRGGKGGHDEEEEGKARKLHGSTSQEKVCRSFW
jgi:hypothetical protein